MCLLFGARAANPTVPVTPGRYVVEVRDGPISAKQTVEVRDNRPATVTLMLNAGSGAHPRARPQDRRGVWPDALITATDANGALMLAAKDRRNHGTAAGRPPSSCAPNSDFVRAEQTVTITAGRLFAVDIPLNAARLQLTTAGDGAAARLPIFSVLEDDPDAPGGRREVARSAAQPAEFVLPPGTYYAYARQGAVEARERLAVGPGEVVRRTLSRRSGKSRAFDQAARIRRGARTPTSPIR